MSYKQRLAEKKRIEANRPMDSTVAIWDELYRVRLPQVASRSAEHIRRHGVVLSGIKELDADIKNRTIITHISINRMVELFDEGIEVRVCDYEDTKRIYESISIHIQLWKQQLEKGVNIGNAPIADLILMDRFANTVYEHARYQFVGDAIDAIVAKHFTNIQRVNVTNFFKPGTVARLYAGENKNVTVNPNGDTFINAGDTSTPERESYGDFFRNRLIGVSMRRSGNA